MGIREVIATELGISSDDASALVSGYARKHENVNPYQIISDVSMTARNIVNAQPNDEFRHEVMECGKDRVFHAINGFGAKSGYCSAVSCLPSAYSDDVHAWADAIYHAAGHIFEKRAFSNGIDGYREYISTLPFGGHAMMSFARALNEDARVAKFLAENGTKKDFRAFMLDIREDSVHGCPAHISDIIYNTAKTKPDFYFDSVGLMKGCSLIHRAEGVKDESALQAGFIDAFMDKEKYVDLDRMDAILASNIEHKDEALTAYYNAPFGGFDGFDQTMIKILNHPDNPLQSRAMDALLTLDVNDEDCLSKVSEMLYPDKENTVSKRYDALLDTLKSEPLSLQKYSETFKNSGLWIDLVAEFLQLQEDILSESFYWDLSELDSILDALNDKERQNAAEFIEQVMNGEKEIDSGWVSLDKNQPIVVFADDKRIDAGYKEGHYVAETPCFWADEDGNIRCDTMHKEGPFRGFECHVYDMKYDNGDYVYSIKDKNGDWHDLFSDDISAEKYVDFLADHTETVLNLDKTFDTFKDFSAYVRRSEAPEISVPENMVDLYLKSHEEPIDQDKIKDDFERFSNDMISAMSEHSSPYNVKGCIDQYYAPNTRDEKIYFYYAVADWIGHEADEYIADDYNETDYKQFAETILNAAQESLLANLDARGINVISASVCLDCQHEAISAVAKNGDLESMLEPFNLPDGAADMIRDAVKAGTFSENFDLERLNELAEGIEFMDPNDQDELNRIFLEEEILNPGFDYYCILNMKDMIHDGDFETEAEACFRAGELFQSEHLSDETNNRISAFFHRLEQDLEQEYEAVL